MTQESQPGLGSGALREALEHTAKLFHRSCAYASHTSAHAGVTFEDCMEIVCLENRRVLALSLSSPIEPVTETLIRMFLWQGHGHEGIYGDDGEMQCGECGVDYKRDSLDICVEKARVAALQTGLAKLAAPTPQASSEIRERELIAKWRKQPSHQDTMPLSEAAQAIVFARSLCADELEEALAPSRQGAGGD